MSAGFLGCRTACFTAVSGRLLCLYYRRLVGKGIAALGIRGLVCCFCKVSECSELLGREDCEVRGELQAKSIKISAQQWAQGSTRWKEFRVCAKSLFQCSTLPWHNQLVIS
jgi:hypothetical protein